MAKPRVSEAIAVEGRYDRNTLSQAVEAHIVELGGFGVFHDRQKLALLRRLAEARGLVIFTDPDGAGFLIRNYLRGALGGGRVLHAYVPDVYGKERRKRRGGKEGKLGVEGFSPEALVAALRRAGATIDGENAPPRGAAITSADLLDAGLIGPGSAAKRAALLRSLDLPAHMSGRALLETLNLFWTKDDLPMG